MRAWNRLRASFVERAKGEGRWADGGGLYLQCKNGGKGWVFHYQRGRRRRAMGLGSTRMVPLALARELAADCRADLARGLDPIELRAAKARAAAAERAKAMTFRACAEQYLATNAGQWRNGKHRKQWDATLARYVHPVLGHLPVAAVDSGLVLKVLEPLLAAGKAVTASRVRYRIARVLDYAKALERRDGDNPAAKDVIAQLLPMRSEKADVRHLPALPHAELPKLMAALRAMPGLQPRLLELIILTGMRFEAVRAARVGEFDLRASAPVWTIPAARMKTLGRDQRVPLVGRALAIARALTAGRDGEALLFAGPSGEKPIAASTIGKRTLPKLAKAIGHDAPVTTHGFRSTLTDWAHETTSFPHEVIEQALGHRIKSEVERAYRRGDLLDKRRELMTAWDRHCAGERPGAGVIKLARRG